jgi:DNA repair protein RecO (recombination protein O)
LLAPPVFLRADYPALVALDFLAEVTEQALPDHEPNERVFRLLAAVVEEIRLGLRSRPAASGSANGNARDRSRTAGEGLNEAAEDVSEWQWRALIYFSLWVLRLGGWLPPLDVCVQSGVVLAADETAYFERSLPGLVSSRFRTQDSWAMTPESRALALEALRKPLAEIRERSWDRKATEDLRRFLIQRLESHLEMRLKTAGVLEQI